MARRLSLVRTVTFKPTAPFAFDPTFYKPAHFPTGDTCWLPGTRWQTFRWRHVPLGVVFRNKGTPRTPLIEAKIHSGRALSDEFIASFKAEIEYRYNLNLDLSDFYARANRDAILKGAVRRLKGMRPGHQSSLYEYLVVGVMLQNCTVRRSVQMMQSLFARFGTLLVFGGKELWCFWEPGALRNASEEELRALKLGYRAKSIKKIDGAFGAGLMNEQTLRTQDRETQMRELLKLYGVGPATVWYLLFDVFHRFDFFNHVSPWEQKIYTKLFFPSARRVVSVPRLIERFKRYGAYKQLAVHYVWEDLWWRRKNGERIPWLEREIRL